MLHSLHIENYALIDELDITFERGFSVITGETGSGKSIILGALSLLLGERADTKALRNTERKCIIEGFFNIDSEHFERLFEENDLDFDKNCIIRREILPNGKSRAFVNDTPVNVTDLKELGDQLIDIHSQHKNLLLSNKHFQFNVIDTIAESKNTLDEYQQAYATLKNTEREIDDLKDRITQEKASKDYLQFQFDQLNEANLIDENEQNELEEENKTLEHAEEIKTTLCKCDNNFFAENDGLVMRLKDTRRALEGISSVFPRIDDIVERINSCGIEIDDIANELQSINANLDFDQNRLDFVTERLNTIYDLEQKHRVNSIADLIALRKEMGEKLQSIDNFDETLAKLETERAALATKVNKLGDKLTDLRKKSIPKIEQTICRDLMSLGIPNANFRILLLPCEATTMGKEAIEFQFSANKNIAPLDIAKIASGGEVARVMLCIKALLSSQSGIATIIFDEIDTGVSGEIANKMGLIMQSMGETTQVISITHLPQIAAKGKMHYKVSKFDTESSTHTKIEHLSDEERVTEIAQMLSGNPPSEAAIGNAKELLKM